MNLAQLPNGKFAKVIGIKNCLGCVQRLENLGLREGITIQKIRGMFMRGPIIVQAGNTQIALGRGMALKVTVEEI